jgi:hypothetical protein
MISEREGESDMLCSIMKRIIRVISDVGIMMTMERNNKKL